MPLIDQIQSEVKVAMKAREAERLSTLRMLLSELKRVALDQGKDLTEAEEIAVLTRSLKQRRESADAYEKADRPDQAAKERAEATLIQTYLPEPVSDEELAAAVAKVVADCGAESMRDMGKVMGPVMKLFPGRVDGNRAKQAVQAALGQG